MKTLVINNQKGGVGKTTVSVLATWFLAERGRVLAIDLDSQAHSTLSLKQHAGSVRAAALFTGPALLRANKLITLASASEELIDVDAMGDPILATFRNNLAAVDALFDYCVIDTPPAWCPRVLASILAADAILAPIEMGDYSMVAAIKLIQAMQGVSKRYKRPEPTFLGLLPNQFDRKSPRDRANLEQLQTEAPKLLFDGILVRRDAYKEAMGTGVPPWQLRGAAAKVAGEEARAVLGRIASQLDGKIV